MNKYSNKNRIKMAINLLFAAESKKNERRVILEFLEE